MLRTTALVKVPVCCSQGMPDHVAKRGSSPQTTAPHLPSVGAALAEMRSTRSRTEV